MAYAPNVVGPTTYIAVPSIGAPVQAAHAASPQHQQQLTTTVGLRRSLSPTRAINYGQQRSLPVNVLQTPIQRISDGAAGVAGSIGYSQVQVGSHVAPPQIIPPAENLPASTGLQQDDSGQNTDNEFMRLLDSLEVRVDLMAQMQHTRNQIQARAKAVEEQEAAGSGVRQASLQTTLDDTPVTPQPLATNRVLLQPPQYVVGPALTVGAPTTTTTTISATAWSTKQRQVEKLAAELQQARTELQGERVARQSGQHLQEAAGAVERSRLQQENEELWSELKEQRECIGRLTTEVEDLRGRLWLFSGQLGCGTGPEEVRTRLTECLGSTREKEAEVKRLHAMLLQEQERREQDTRERMTERENLQKEIQGLKAASASSPKRLSTSSGGGVASLDTTPLLPQSPAPVIDTGEPLQTAPFSRQMCGVNVTLSEDGYVATRTRGCRQSVLIGSEPLARQPLGYYFEVEIRETVEGWVGGLGVGVTRTSASMLRRVPDKAWRMPNTFIIGYWGCVFLDGQERRTKWRADAVKSGSRIGVLVSGDGSGDLRLFVDGVLQVSVEGALADHMPIGVELYPVVDVFAATLAVALQPSSTPPSPPWGSVEASRSPPGSPTASLASVSRSLCSTTASMAR